MNVQLSFYKLQDLINHQIDSLNPNEIQAEWLYELRSFFDGLEKILHSESLAYQLEQKASPSNELIKKLRKKSQNELINLLKSNQGDTYFLGFVALEQLLNPITYSAPQREFTVDLEQIKSGFDGLEMTFFSLFKLRNERQFTHEAFANLVLETLKLKN